MKLIFVRHGQTELNKKGILQGQEIDEPLNDAGRAQIEETAKSLPEDVDLIISSPLKRAAESAALINLKFNLPIEHRSELMELSYGTLAGKTWEENERKTGLDATREKEKEIDVTFDYRSYGGESGEDLKQRVKGCIEEIITRAEKSVLIITHAGVIDAMYTLFPQQGRKGNGNASIHEFIF